MVGPILIRSREYRSVPWKNGGGRSDEIAIFPQAAEFSKDPFLWRLSSAAVQEAGPFSVFSGYDRFLTLINESELKIQMGSQPIRSVFAGEVIRFSGDEPVQAQIPAGPVVDLGLIFKRGQVQAEFKVLELTEKPRSFQCEGKMVFLFAITGPISATLYPGELKWVLESHDTLQIDLREDEPDEDRLVMLESVGKRAAVAWVELSWI